MGQRIAGCTRNSMQVSGCGWQRHAGLETGDTAGLETCATAHEYVLSAKNSVATKRKIILGW